MGEKAYVEVVRRVYDGTEGASVEVLPYEDGSFVMVKTSDDKNSIEWFGKKDMSFTPKVARAIGECMIRCADDIESV